MQRILSIHSGNYVCYGISQVALTVVNKLFIADVFLAWLGSFSCTERQDGRTDEVYVGFHCGHDVAGCHTFYSSHHTRMKHVLFINLLDLHCHIAGLIDLKNGCHYSHYRNHHHQCCLSICNIVLYLICLKTC